MRAEIITIGDEILIGQTVDTNSAWMAHELNLIGVDVTKIVSISDKQEEITKALDNSVQSVDLVLITGGLGPTDDDITKKTLAEYFDTKLVLNNDVLKHIERFVIKRKSFMNERNVKQAEVPEGCKIIQNEIGTAPGMWFEKDGKIIISMPGVAFEMKKMMEETILPELETKRTSFEIIHRTVLTQGWPESKLAEYLEEWEKNLPDVISLAYLPSPGIIKLRFTAKGENKKYLQDTINHKIQKLETIIPQLICGYDSDKLEEITGRLLESTGKTLSVAESCTGGNIAHLITSIPGSSSYFLGGAIAYSNDVKINLLGVSNSNIDKYGAVSKQVVEDMARGAIKRFQSDYAVATSGVAGPTGGTAEKPVGTIWIAVCDDSKVISQKFVFGNHRGRNIQMTSVTALNMLRKLILEREM